MAKLKNGLEIDQDIKNGVQPGFYLKEGWWIDDTQDLLAVLNEEIGKVLEKLGAKIRWTWCGKILSWTERSMVSGSWALDRSAWGQKVDIILLLVWRVKERKH